MMGDVYDYPNTLDRFLVLGSTYTYGAGELIISAGDYSSELYYLLRGSVSVQFNDAEGHEIILAYLNQGDFFGEIGLLDARRERSAWVRARTDSTVVHLPHDILHIMLRDAPEVVFTLLGQLALRLRDTSRKASELAFTDVAGRVARALLDLGKQPDAQPHPRGLKITATRLEIGRLAGCSREMVSRVLRTLEERRIIDFDGRSIVLNTQDSP